MPEDPAMRQWIQGEWAAGRLTRPQQAVMQLLQNPENFLRKHPILNTYDCNAHGTGQAYFRNGSADAKRPGGKLGTMRMHRTEYYNLESISGANAYGYAFPVHGVHMTPGPAGPSWYRLDATGPAMMLTAKLTGCTFVARPAAGGAVEVTHLQPGQNLDGLALNRQMRAPGQAAYGRLKYDFDKRSINVVGVRHGGQWRIWAQKLDKNAAVPTIISLKRIWPL